MIDHRHRTEKTAVLVDELHRIVTQLEEMHPGRKFPLDGHLVGSIGEAAAEAMFNITLVPSSTAGHDAKTDGDKAVEIKATYQNKGVAIRPTSDGKADFLLVLRLSRLPGVEHEVVYNGPMQSVLAFAGPVQSNGQRRVSLSRLRTLDASVASINRVSRRALGTPEGWND